MWLLMADVWTWFSKCMKTELKGKDVKTKVKWKKEFKKAAHKCQKLYTKTHPKRTVHRPK